MSVMKSRFWDEFLDLYKKRPVLWKVKSADYGNRTAKSMAYEEMVEKLKEIDANANRETVVRKINIFRSNYRREYKKLKRSIAEGDEEPYQSALWYFDKLSFLYEEEDEDPLLEAPATKIKTERKSITKPLAPKATQNLRKRKSIEALLEDDDTSFSYKPLHVTRLAPKKHKFETALEDESTQCFKPQFARTAPRKLEDESTHYYKPSNTTSKFVTKTPLASVSKTNVNSVASGVLNEGSILSQTWANQYNELSRRQRILARKMISDVLFFGCLEHLNEAHAAGLHQMICDQSQFRLVTTVERINETNLNEQKAMIFEQDEDDEDDIEYADDVEIN